MKKSFEYFYITSAMDEITIDDIGNCIIECSTDEGYFFYLLIRTALGVTRIIEYGPFIDGGFPLHCASIFDQFDYDERKISKKIEKFLGKPLVTQARVVNTFDEISDRLIEVMRYYNDDYTRNLKR